jgi:GABA(A) receptor-associated protein
MMDFNYKKHSFEKRIGESTKMLSKHPNSICVIIEKAEDDNSIDDIDKHKYLIPKELTVGQLLYVIRKRIHLTPQQAIFFYINNTLPSSSTTIESLYQNNKDPDGFLYIKYTGENTFG